MGGPENLHYNKLPFIVAAGSLEITVRNYNVAISPLVIVFHGFSVTMGTGLEQKVRPRFNLNIP